MIKKTPRIRGGFVSTIDAEDLNINQRLRLCAVAYRIFDGTDWYLYERGEKLRPDHMTLINKQIEPGEPV